MISVWTELVLCSIEAETQWDFHRFKRTHRKKQTKKFQLVQIQHFYSCILSTIQFCHRRLRWFTEQQQKQHQQLPNDQERTVKPKRNDEEQNGRWERSESINHFCISFAQWPLFVLIQAEAMVDISVQSKLKFQTKPNAEKTKTKKKTLKEKNRARSEKIVIEECACKFIIFVWREQNTNKQNLWTRHAHMLWHIHICADCINLNNYIWTWCDEKKRRNIERGVSLQATR